MSAESDGNGRHPLGDALASLGGALADATVLSPQTDPFRLDTDRNNINGIWLRDAIESLSVTGQIHNRGLHYAILSKQIRKPDGTPYTNTARDWTWLESVSK